MKPTAEGAPERIWLCPQNYEAATVCGHPSDTEYVRADLFASAIAAEREKAAKIAEIIPDSKFDLDHEPAPSEHQIRNAIAAAIRAGDDFFAYCSHAVAFFSVPPELSPSGKAWEKWFKRMGERATADVVNATSTLVIEERDIARASVDEAAVRRIVDEVLLAIHDYYVTVLRAPSAEPKFRNRVAEIITTELNSTRSLDASGYVRGLEGAAKIADERARHNSEKADYYHKRVAAAAETRHRCRADEAETIADYIRALISQHQETK